MRTRASYSVLALLSATLLAAQCDPAVPLDEPEAGVLDDRIVGNWVMDTDGERNVFLDPDCTASIVKFNSVEYLYTVRGCDALVDASARVYFTRIAGTDFINVQWITEGKSWEVFLAEVTDGAMLLRRVGLSARTSAELRQKVEAALATRGPWGGEAYRLKRAAP